LCGKVHWRTPQTTFRIVKSAAWNTTPALAPLGFTEDFQDRVRLRDGAADDVTDGLTAPFGQRGPAIGYEAVNVEHEPVLME
jgi:hypothetical protein